MSGFALEFPNFIKENKSLIILQQLDNKELYWQPIVLNLFYGQVAMPTIFTERDKNSHCETKLHGCVKSRNTSTSVSKISPLSRWLLWFTVWL